MEKLVDITEPTILANDEVLIPNLNTLADVIDRLIIEVNKIAFFENKKREENKSPNPDAENIRKWDDLSRDANEYRSLLKNEINRLLTVICETGEYKTLKELRTFSPSGKTIEDLLADNCELAPNIVQRLLGNYDFCKK